MSTPILGCFRLIYNSFLEQPRTVQVASQKVGQLKANKYEQQLTFRSVETKLNSSASANWKIFRFGVIKN